MASTGQRAPRHAVRARGKREEEKKKKSAGQRLLDPARSERFFFFFFFFCPASLLAPLIIPFLTHTWGSPQPPRVASGSPSQLPDPEPGMVACGRGGGGVGGSGLETGDGGETNGGAIEKK